MGDDYDNMSDSELRSRLQDAGINCGPIMASTRKMYINKLKRLAGELPNVSSTVADCSEDDEDDDSPPSTPPTESKKPERPKTARLRTSPATSGDGSEVRQRKPQTRKLDVKVEKEIQESSGSGFMVGFTRFLLLIMMCTVIYVVYYIYSQQTGRQRIE